VAYGEQNLMNESKSATTYHLNNGKVESYQCDENLGGEGDDCPPQCAKLVKC